MKLFSVAALPMGFISAKIVAIAEPFSTITFIPFGSWWWGMCGKVGCWSCCWWRLYLCPFTRFFWRFEGLVPPFSDRSPLGFQLISDSSAFVKTYILCISPRALSSAHWYFWLAIPCLIVPEIAGGTFLERRSHWVHKRLLEACRRHAMRQQETALRHNNAGKRCQFNLVGHCDWFSVCRMPLNINVFGLTVINVHIRSECPNRGEIGESNIGKIF